MVQILTRRVVLGCICTLLFLTNSLKGFAQEYTNEIYAGASFTDFVHMGFKKKLKVNAVGLQVGYFKDDISDIYTLAITNEFTLSTSKKYEGEPCWYVKQQLTYNKEKNTENYWDRYFLELYAGRNIHLSKRFGFRFETGLWFTVSESKNRKSLHKNSDDSSGYPIVFPNLRIQLFTRF